MSKPFDSTTKHLIEDNPRDWLAYAGLPDAEVEVVDANLSTITSEADKILRLKTDPPNLAHFEMQASLDLLVDERTLQYNVLAGWRHKMSVVSVIILLRPKADAPHLTGTLQRRLSDGRIYLNFAYVVVRAWEKTAEAVLAGGLATLPLAPLSNVTLAELPDVIARMKARIDAETTREYAGQLWTATNILMGLRYSEATAEELLKGVRDMEESVTYQAIVEKGRQRGIQEGIQEGRQKGRQEGGIAEARRTLLRLGSKRFGAPTEATRAAVEAMTALETLENLIDRVLDVENWSELFTV